MNENIEKNMEINTGDIGLSDGLYNNGSDDISNGFQSGHGPETAGTDETAFEGTANDMELLYNTSFYSVSPGDSPALQAETEIPATYDYTETLQSIDNKLSLIIFLILSFWVIKHIRISVRNFTGRGIDE